MGGQRQHICLESPGNALPGGPLAELLRSHTNDVYCISSSPHWGSLFKQFGAGKSGCWQGFVFQPRVDGAVGVLLPERALQATHSGLSSSRIRMCWALRRGLKTFFESGRLFLGCSSWMQVSHCPAQRSKSP